MDVARSGRWSRRLTKLLGRRRLQADRDPWNVIPDSIVAQGERVVAIGTYSGRNKASGKDFQARFAHVWDFSGDKLRRLEQIVDSAKVNEAL